MLNAADDARFAMPAYGRRQLRPYGVLAALLISLLLHALFLYGYRFSAPAPHTDEAKKVESLTVWIRPLARPAPPPAPPAAAIHPERATAAATPRPANAAPRVAVKTPASETPTETTASVFTMPAPRDPQPVAEPTADAKPKFDMEAARRAARQIATTPDPARAGLAVAQIPEKPIASETALARNIQGATRANCKDGLTGGLLAPIYLLMDKKDSGCKW